MKKEDKEPVSDPNIIIDNGSSYYKAGFSEEKEEGPRIISPELVARPIRNSPLYGKEDYYIGKNAKEKIWFLKQSYPIKRGLVENWDDMEIIWEHIFSNELECDPKEYNTLLTEAPFNPKKNRETMAEILFEEFQIPGLYFEIPAILALYSIGKFNGTVCDIGGEVTHIASCYNGYSLPHSIKRVNIGGRDITNYLYQLLHEADFFKSKFELEIMQELKEKFCYVALDLDKEEDEYETKMYELADGEIVTLKEQQFKGPECLFQPDLIGHDFYEELGLGKLCNESIKINKDDIKKDLYENIFLSGGTSMFKGLQERLTLEVKKLAPKSVKESIKVKALPECKYAAWLGGSILSSLSDFSSNWITQEEYEESGTDIVYQKTFEPKY